MRLTQEQRLRKTIRWLRKTFVPEKPFYGACVYTEQRPLKNLCGDCSNKGGWFLIRINKKSSYQVKLDTLLHEWAHALTWFEHKYEEHPNVWGEAYARIYRAWLKWDFGRGEK